MLCSELILREWREFVLRCQLRSDVEEVEHEGRMGVKLSVQERKEVSRRWGQVMSRVKRKQKAVLSAVISGRKRLSEYFTDESRCAFCHGSSRKSQRLIALFLPFSIKWSICFRGCYVFCQLLNEFTISLILTIQNSANELTPAINTRLTFR